MENISDIVIVSFLLGTIFYMIQDLIMSLIDYLNNKAWLVRDYEELIYKQWLVGDYEKINFEEKETICIAINNYSKRLNKKKKLNKFLDRFRRRKNG